jgi:hypothetical protein
MIYESTEDVQNGLRRMVFNVDLNIDKPTAKQKRQYYKAINALNKAVQEFDLLNDMKDI